MSLFDGIKRLFGRHKVEEYYDVHEEDDVPEVENLRRSEIDMSESILRMVFPASSETVYPCRFAFMARMSMSSSSV